VEGDTEGIRGQGKDIVVRGNQMNKNRGLKYLEHMGSPRWLVMLGDIWWHLAQCLELCLRSKS
jgi:hypothetical protein